MTDTSGAVAPGPPDDIAAQTSLHHSSADISSPSPRGDAVNGNESRIRLPSTDATRSAHARAAAR
jgi:hypothetical protein